MAGSTAVLGLTTPGAWRGLSLRLMPFLVDAHQRGLLRQVGPVYQFRHRRVAERIATAHTTP